MARNITTMTKAQAAQGMQWAPYSTLDERAEGYFYALLESRPSYEWAKPDIVALTRVAKWLAQSDELAFQMDMEGITITNLKGTEVLNPLFSAVDQLERRIAAVMAKLAIFRVSSNNLGTKSTIGARAKDALALAEKTDDDELVG